MKKVLKVKKFSLTNKFEDKFNEFTDGDIEIKSVQFKKIDKYETIVLVWYYVERS